MTKRTVLNQLTGYEEIECLVGKKINDVYETDDNSIVITIEKSETENYMIFIDDKDGVVHFGVKNIENALEKLIKEKEEDLIRKINNRLDDHFERLKRLEAYSRE